MATAADATPSIAVDARASDDTSIAETSIAGACIAVTSGAGRFVASHGCGRSANSAVAQRATATTRNA